MKTFELFLFVLVICSFIAMFIVKAFIWTNLFSSLHDAMHDPENMKMIFSEQDYWFSQATAYFLGRFNDSTIPTEVPTRAIPVNPLTSVAAANQHPPGSIGATSAKTLIGKNTPKLVIINNFILFIIASLLINTYCQNITTENTEKIFSFKKLIEMLLPPLCVLMYYFLFSSFSFYS